MYTRVQRTMPNCSVLDTIALDRCDCMMSPVNAVVSRLREPVKHREFNVLITADYTLYLYTYTAFACRTRSGKTEIAASRLYIENIYEPTLHRIIELTQLYL